MRALCSADGQAWFTLRAAACVPDDRVEVGVFAIDTIDRTLYPGAFIKGAAIRFERYDLWELPGDPVSAGTSLRSE